MRIAKIINDSPAEVEGHFADVIYMQGCNRNCCYCFNPELRDLNKYCEIQADLTGTLSDVVVITGGEPCIQDIYSLIFFIKNDLKKKIVIETAEFCADYWDLADKILYCIKTFDINEEALKEIDNFDNVIPVVVVGHPCFDWNGFVKAINSFDKPIYIRYYNDEVRDARKLWKVLHVYNKKYKVFKKICL